KIRCHVVVFNSVPLVNGAFQNPRREFINDTTSHQKVCLLFGGYRSVLAILSKVTFNIPLDQARECPARVHNGIRAKPLLLLLVGCVQCIAYFLNCPGKRIIGTGSRRRNDYPPAEATCQGAKSVQDIRGGNSLELTLSFDLLLHHSTPAIR